MLTIKRIISNTSNHSKYLPVYNEYEVVLEEAMTVGDFIQEVLKSEYTYTWGSIGIYKEGQDLFDAGDPHCIYSKGLILPQLPDHFQDLMIENVTAFGKFSMMSYVLKVQAADTSNNNPGGLHRSPSASTGRWERAKELGIVGLIGAGENPAQVIDALLMRASPKLTNFMLPDPRPQGTLEEMLDCIFIGKVIDAMKEPRVLRMYDKLSSKLPNNRAGRRAKTRRRRLNRKNK
jgi:hypothetical protein